MKPFLACLACFAFAAPSFGVAPAVDYLRDIKPVLAKNCVSCHGPAKQKGKLRLDTVAAALKGGASGPAVMPGKSQASTLWQCLTGQGDIPRMPPKGPRLTAAQIAMLKSWIDAGAKAPAQELAGAPVPGNKLVPRKPGKRGVDDDDDDDDKGREHRKMAGQRRREALKKARERVRERRRD